MLKLSRALPLAALSLALLAACSTNPKSEPVKTEKAYFDSAQKSMSAGNFSTAAEELESLESHYPVGVYTEQAELQLIYAKYQHIDYAGAAAAADRFIRLHPGNSQLDYAMYLKGLADFELGSDNFNRYLPMDPAHRDLSAERDAFADLRTLLTRFPDSQYAPDARQRMVYLRNQFAEAEMHVARFYMKRHAWVAALARARWVVEGYQGAPVIPEALAAEVYCYQRLSLTTQADGTLALLKANFPHYKGLGDKDQIKVELGKNNENRSWLNIATFGLLGSDNVPD
jgi:outer membrane protein assembly factor BamD